MTVPRPERNVPPAIDELFRTLPDAGKVFEQDQRTKFLKACEAVFDIVYQRTEKGTPR